jgi:predicted CoA-binding protein
MTTKASIQGVLGQKVLAVAGVSRDPHKFGNMAYHELIKRGFQVMAVNPNVDSVDGDPCYGSLANLPQPAEALVVITQPAVTEKLVQEAAALGIRNIWLQQGSESAAAIQYCLDRGINVVSGECIMMFQDHPAFPHSLHRFIMGILGRLPK